MIHLIITMIAWIGFSICLGKYDAILYFYKARYYEHQIEVSDPHPISTSMRGFFLSGSIIIPINLGCIDAILVWVAMTISLSLIFSFFHNGVYFSVRGKMEPNLNYNWFTDEGKGSTALENFTYHARLLMAIVGFILFLGILGFVYYLKNEIQK